MAARSVASLVLLWGLALSACSEGRRIGNAGPGGARDGGRAADGAQEVLDGDRLDVLVTLIDAWEALHYPMDPPDPIEAIKFRMEQQGLVAKDLEPYIGSSGRVSEVLNRKRSLSLRMVKRLHDGLKIPYESLLSHVA